MSRIDMTDGETQAYVNDAARVLAAAWRHAQTQDEDGVGAGGPVDNALSLIAYLAGHMEEELDAEEYARELWKAAANTLIDNTPAVRHSL